MNPILIVAVVFGVFAWIGGVIFCFVAGYREWHDPYGRTMSYLAWILGVMVLGIGLLIAGLSLQPEEQLVAGHCYQAVAHDSTYYVQAGSVMIPSTTTDIGLVEVACP